MEQFEPNGGFSLLLFAAFWCTWRIVRCIEGENNLIRDINRHLAGNDVRPEPTAPVTRVSRLRLHLPGQPAWRAAAAITSFILLCATPASPEAHERPLRPLRLQAVIEQASQPLAEPTAPCSSISLRYARQLAEESANLVEVEAGLVLAVIFHESRFAPCAVSSSGARGLMQLMPATLGDFGVEEAFDPRGNVAGGTRYLRYLLDRYHGDTELALAAYKCGMGAVDERRGRPASLATREYVDNIVQLAADLATN